MQLGICSTTIKVVTIFMIMTSLILVVSSSASTSTSTSTSISQNCQTSQVISKTPQKFGIQTMTYTRSLLKDSMMMFQKYLEHYANMNCDCFDNIYIIWNNQQSPQQRGVTISNKWIKNVIFTKTPYNSLDWKYVIPETAPEKVFFTVDDDLYLNCDQLKKGFQTWKQNSVGDLGPLVSYTKRSMMLNLKKQEFTYERLQVSRYYSISLMNCAFFSRQFTDLYYSDFQEIRRIRKIVQKKLNCEDIAMNFVVSYFYPQLIPKIQQKTYKITYTPGISDGSDHYSKRNACMNQFTKLISYNPLRYIYQQASTNFQRLDQKCIILKKQEHYKSIIRHKTPQQIFQSDSMFNPSLTSQQAESLQVKFINQRKQQQGRIQQQKNEQKKQKQLQIQRLKQKGKLLQEMQKQKFVQKSSKNTDQKEDRNRNDKANKNTNNENTGNQLQKPDSNAQIENQKQTNVYIIVILCLVFLLLIVQCTIICLQRRKLKEHKAQKQKQQNSTFSQLKTQPTEIMHFNKSNSKKSNKYALYSQVSLNEKQTDRKQ